MSIRKVIRPKPRIGERSNPISGGTIPRKSRRYGSVILPKEENGWVKIDKYIDENMANLLYHHIQLEACHYYHY